MAGEWRADDVYRGSRPKAEQALGRPGANVYMNRARGTPVPSGDGTAPDPGMGSNYAPAPGTSAPTPEGPLSGPGYGEDWYKQYGQDLMNTPSASEDLYARGVEASNPYYDYAEQQAIKAINDASAARGNFNSSYTLKNIGNTVADIRGQQAKGLTDLAGQADAGKFGRYDRGSSYSGRAQNLMEDRARGGIDAYGDLARSQADMTRGFYGAAGDQYSAANMAAIEAALKASGMDAAEAKAYVDFIGSVGGILAKRK